MKSSPKQFCEIINYCMEHYSKNTIRKLADMLDTHEAVIRIHQILEKEPTETELLTELNKIEKKKIKTEI